ncbi:hypothetical protein [Lishizhenia sp.]|uniref:hypothetical protein n=1 Tax=Lishizhenia sp. TaxID=2497594 RepID=UPI00299E478F|nr:hypothetical protein [Lishizhenia sp.]MDX1444578.1 hypothetical protein [Lishizhenia sp.]
MKLYHCIFLLLIILLTTSFSTKKHFPKALYVELVIPLNDSVAPRAEGLVLMDSVLYYSNSALTSSYLAKSFRCYEKDFSSSFAYYQGICRSDIEVLSNYFREEKDKKKDRKPNVHKLRVCNSFGTLSLEVKSAGQIKKIVKNIQKLKGLSARTKKMFSSWDALEACK